MDGSSGSGPESGLTLPDTLKVASAYGIEKLFTINSGNEVERITAEVLNSDGPAVCEVTWSPLIKFMLQG